MDDVWFRNRIVDTPYLRRVISRPTYYAINRLVMVDVCDMLAEAKRPWRRHWFFGAAVTGDETIVPNKGKKARKLQQLVPWKPNSTRLEMYCFTDGVRAYVPDIFL